MKEAKTWEDILAKLLYWKVKDDQRSDAMGEFIAIFSPGSHAPILEPCLTTAFLDAIELSLGEDVMGWLSYLIYEVTMGEKWEVTTKEGKEYDFGSKGGALQFLKDEYPLPQTP